MGFGMGLLGMFGVGTSKGGCGPVYRPFLEATPEQKEAFKELQAKWERAHPSGQEYYKSGRPRRFSIRY